MALLRRKFHLLRANLHEDTPAILAKHGTAYLCHRLYVARQRCLLNRQFKFPTLPITWVALLWLGILGSGHCV